MYVCVPVCTPKTKLPLYSFFWKLEWHEVCWFASWNPKKVEQNTQSSFFISEAAGTIKLVCSFVTNALRFPCYERALFVRTGK